MTHTQQLIDQGENAQIEFKSAQVRPDSVAREIVSFANTLGGTLLIGIEDNGTVSGKKIIRCRCLGACYFASPNYFVSAFTLQ